MLAIFIIWCHFSRAVPACSPGDTNVSEKALHIAPRTKSLLPHPGPGTISLSTHRAGPNTQCWQGNPEASWYEQCSPLTPHTQAGAGGSEIFFFHSIFPESTHYHPLPFFLGRDSTGPLHALVVIYSTHLYWTATTCQALSWVIMVHTI